MTPARMRQSWGGGGGMGGGDPGPRNPILQGPVLPSFCRVTSAWLFCCSSLHSCSRARVCSASRGFLASFAFRGGQAGGTTGAAPSSGPDLHHRSSHCPTSTLLPLAPSCPQPPPAPPEACLSRPPPSAHLTHSHCPRCPQSPPRPKSPPLPCGATEHGWAGQAGDPDGVLGPLGGPCPRWGLWVLTPSPLSLQVQSCANEKRVSESGMVAADPIPSPCPQPQDTPRCSHGDNRAPAPPSTHSPLPQGTPGCSTQHPCPGWRLPLGHPKTAAPPAAAGPDPEPARAPGSYSTPHEGLWGVLGGASCSQSRTRCRHSAARAQHALCAGPVHALHTLRVQRTPQTPRAADTARAAPGHALPASYMLHPPHCTCCTACTCRTRRAPALRALQGCWAHTAYVGCAAHAVRIDTARLHVQRALRCMACAARSAHASAARAVCAAHKGPVCTVQTLHTHCTHCMPTATVCGYTLRPHAGHAPHALHSLHTR